MKLDKPWIFIESPLLLRLFIPESGNSKESICLIEEKEICIPILLIPEYFEEYPILIHANSTKITNIHAFIWLVRRGSWQKVVLIHHQYDIEEAKKGSIPFSIMLEIVLI